MDEFEHALKAWVDDAIEAFASHSDSAVSENVMWPRTRWVPDEGDNFVLRNRPAITWSNEFVDAIYSLPSFEEVRVAAEADPVIGPQLGTAVGTVLARHQLDLKQLAGSMLPEPILLRGVAMLSEHEAFEDRWTRLKRFLTEVSVEQTAFLPLAGVAVEDPPVILEEGVMLDRMDDAEIDLGLRFGMIPRTFAHMPLVALEAGKRFCVRHLYRLPKLVDGSDLEDTTAVLAEAEHVWDRVDRIAGDFAEAAALVGPGRFGVLGIIEHETIQIFGHGVRWRAIAEQQLLRFAGQHLVIGPSEAEALTACWERLRVKGFRERNRGISLALRRFASHGLRKDLDDQVIDLMISAEALYLSDLGNQKYRGELRNRLALRAAIWAEPDIVDLSRRHVFELMQSAYDARSAIAHGGQPKPKDIKVRGERVELDGLIDATKAVLRHAIHRAVQGESDSWPLAWEDVILDQFDATGSR